MGKLIVIPEIKKIAGMNEKIIRLENIIENKMETDGLDFQNAYFVNGCKEKNGHLYQGDSRLDNGGLVDGLYYCCQYTGYCEGDFYGTLYFKTNVPGQFVAVPFRL